MLRRVLTRAGTASDATSRTRRRRRPGERLPAGVEAAAGVEATARHRRRTVALLTAWGTDTGDDEVDRALLTEAVEDDPTLALMTMMAVADVLLQEVADLRGRDRSALLQAAALATARFDDGVATGDVAG